MKTLSGLDATFLYLETPQTPMHVGSLSLFELPAGFRGSFHKAVQAHVGQRMHLAPVFSRKLAFMPMDLGHPAWVEADEVDLSYHVRKVGGSRLSVRAVQQMCAQLHGELIDRDRPLWEFYIFDSVLRADGVRCAGFYSKIHHAALDGKGGTVLANAILDLSAVPREVPPPDPSRKGRRQGELKIGAMIGAVLTNSLAQYAKLARSLPAAAASVGSAVGSAVARQTQSGAPLKAKVPLQLAPKTMFNTGITKRRSFVSATLPFGECRAIAKATGGSFNDIVLWLCSTALRTYLANHASIPRKPLVAAMPVSLREEGNQELNNQASITVVDLGTHLAQPQARLQAIMASTGKVKNALAGLKSVLPTDYPSLLSPWVVGGAGRVALQAYGRSGMADRLPMVANLAISNVPGPRVPLYLAGARMLSFHPLSIVMHGLALNITVQTYGDSVDFGIIAGAEAAPQLQDLADALAAAFEEAKSLVPPAQPVPPPPPAQKAKAVRKKSTPAAPKKAAAPRARSKRAL